MLYDNGALLALYAEAWAATDNPLFRQTCEQTAAWVMREMQAEDGGYYSSLDADSEGEEGRFYTWTQDAVRELLDETEYPLVARHFGLDRPPNFEGRWHLHVYRTREQLAGEFSLDATTLERRLDSALGKLFSARERRVRPGRDDKVLTAWNGLMIHGMALAGRLLDRQEWTDSARRAVDFIHEELWRDGRLLATCKDGRAHLNAYLDDYVYLIDGLLELLQAQWRDRDLLFAIELAEAVLEHFRDPDGGFYFTSDDHEALIQRPKPIQDDATPSGNGIAARVLSRLGHLLGEPSYLEAAQRTLQGLWSSLEHMPHAHASLLVALEESLNPVQTVIVRGNEPAIDAWRKRLNRCYAPRRLGFVIPGTARALPGVLAQRTADGDAVAYICTGTSCSAPVADFAEFATQLALTEVMSKP
jgi:hypothetical protein